MDMENKKPDPLQLLKFVVLLFVAVVGVGAAAYKIWEKPPELAPQPDVNINSEVEQSSSKNKKDVTDNRSEMEVEDIEGKPLNERQNGVYTILFVGKDRVGCNTDTLMLSRFDTVNHTINVVSIPRDTYANINWMGCRKINCVYSGVREMHLDPGPIDRLILEIGRITGVTADCYVVIDLETFIEAVDLIGGVYYDVPSSMDYDDINQDLHIHIQAGPQILDGYSAMCLWRYRAGYKNGDLGRLDAQHLFLSAVADSFLSLGTVPKLDELITLISSNTETNLTAANIAWLARQFFKCSGDNIRFSTMPWIANMANGFSYVFPNLEPWLDVINSELNPYSREITAGDLDCICIDPENYTYFPSSGNFVDPSYLHAWRYYSK